MGGVDRVAQRLSFYVLPSKKGKTYLKKIFFHLLGLSALDLDSHDFRLKIIVSKTLY